jgi:sugar/nucleoside kinase (ribokinase family)
MVVTRHGEKLDGAKPADPNALIEDADVVMADNRFPVYVRPICEAARAHGIPVVLDVDKTTRPGDALVDLASHRIFSSEALRATTGLTDLGVALTNIAASMHGFLAVTDGAGDVLWINGGVLRRMPVMAVEAADTLGAGDVFHGAFALALAEGQGETTAMRFAATAAALKCRRFGGIDGAPGREEVEAALARNFGLK